MIRIVLFLAALAAVAFGVSWLLDRPGEVTILWLGERIETSVFVALGLVFLACVVFALLWSLFAFAFSLPSLMSLARRAQKQARGRDALSRGMVAVGAGDVKAARRAANEAARALPHEPMELLLRAQVAQMEGDRAGAEAAFAAMAAKDSTRLLGLRGLHVEARRRGDAEAAHRFAREAHRVAPLPWAGEAIVTHHALRSEWTDALAIVESNARAKTIDAKTANRQRAVLEAALARDNEFVDVDGALKAARSAVKRAPDLVPAVALTARLLSRRGEFRAASKMIERAWNDGPHPELAAAYLSVRPGDSNADRFARATALARRMPDHPESRMLVAEVALAKRDFARAREAMRPLVESEARPTTRQCLMIAAIEETEHGETGLLREWLARASRAPRDPTWVADGVTSPRWQPSSPVTGQLDAFRWQTPREELGAPAPEPVLAPVTAEAPRPNIVKLPKADEPHAETAAAVYAHEADTAALPTPVASAADPVEEPVVAAPSDDRVTRAMPAAAPQLAPVPDMREPEDVETPRLPSLSERLQFLPEQRASPAPTPLANVASPRTVLLSEPDVVPETGGTPVPTRPPDNDTPRAASLSERLQFLPDSRESHGQAQPASVVFPLATSPDDPGPRPRGAPYSGGFRS